MNAVTPLCRLIVLALSLALFFTVFPKNVSAASLAGVSDTITTSRPSASAPLYVNQTASSTQATVVDNGSMYLASDSAQINADLGETLATGLNVASMSGEMTIMPSNPVGWWKLDDGSGTTAVDSSGNGNNGTLEGSTDLPAWETNCVQNDGCLSFDGTDDYVQVAHNNGVYDLTGDFTISVWVYPTSCSSGSCYIADYYHSGNEYGLYYNGSKDIVLHTIAGGTTYDVTSSTSAPTNTWTFVLGTYDGRALKLYLNGSLSNSYSVTETRGAGTGSLCIGDASSGSGCDAPANFLFAGKIYDARIYNYPYIPYRIVYFPSAISSAHHAGDPLVAAQTSLQTIAFTTSTPVPPSGKVTIAFPSLASGDANTPASPSASTFQMNGLSPPQILVFESGTNITAHVTASVANPAGAGDSPQVTLTLDAATSLPAGAPVVVYLGCTAGTSSSCTTQDPLIINPTKTAGQGTADAWTIQIQTMDPNNVVLDTSKAAIATIESTEVFASVDPTLTFTIEGISANQYLNDLYNSGCTGGDGADLTAFSTSPDDVNFYDLSAGQISILGQNLRVETNASQGYAITATSSGTLQNPATGYAIHSSTTPTSMTAGTEYFGIHPCGSDVNTGFWGKGDVVDSANGGPALVAWPTPTTALIIASGNSIANSMTTVTYAATISSISPAGAYTSVITYVVTPKF
ncbi:LamG domain-containing protein [Patescibacteria group bacterium]|nr:LamG domain-containing protein [Patescibacteria group bacterium]